MNISNVELSKELYKLSKWMDTHFIHVKWTEESGWVVTDLHHRTVSDWCPAYDLGYLLRKLRINKAKNTNPARWGNWKSIDIGVSIGYDADGKFWWATIKSKGELETLYFESADTPEDAVCKLAIKLFQEGVLSKKGENNE